MNQELNKRYLTLYPDTLSAVMAPMIQSTVQMRKHLPLHIPLPITSNNNTSAIDVKMDGYVLEEKSSFKMLGLTFSSKLDWASYIISIAKTVSKKMEALIRSMKFLFAEVAVYLHKSTIHPCMEYCFHVWVGAPNCYFKLLDKLRNHMQDCWSFTCCLSGTIGSLLKCSQLKSFL